MYPKSKLLSIIASDKNALAGHQLRHEAVRKIKQPMGVYGRAYNPIPSMLPAFEDYMFSIVIENTNQDCNMSEKLITPILCGTIPIYYGCPSVGNHFDIRGMFMFSNIDELITIVDQLTPDMYYEMLEYAKINFEKAKQHQYANEALYDRMVELGIIE